MLGAITEDSRSFFSRFPEYVTAEHANHIISSVYNEFKDDLIVVLDRSSYFRASQVQELANRDGIEFVQLPAYQPDLNPVEKCCRQLESALGNKYFESIEELTTTIDSSFDQFNITIVSNYF